MIEGCTPMTKNILLLLAGCFLFSTPALAATLQPGANVSLQTPPGWNEAARDFGTVVHPTVKHVLSCVDTDSSELKQVGWLIKDGSVEAGYCISYRKSGMGKALGILKNAKGKDREAAADKFADTFAGVIQAGYDKRGIRVEAMNAELIDAGRDVIMVMDGIIHAGSAGTYMRSETVFLHGDSMLSIGAVHAGKAPATVSAQLEAIPLSVKWK